MSGITRRAAVLSALALPALAQNAPLRLGYIVGIESVPMLALQAEAEATARAVGQPVEWMPFLNTSAQLNAFRAGQMEVVQSGVSALAQLHREALPIQVFRGWHHVSFKVLVHRDSPIRDLRGLRGRTLGVASLAGTSYVASAVALRAQGLDPRTDVTIAPAAPTNLIAALETRRMDAVTLWDPFVAQAMRSGNLRVIADLRQVYQDAFGEAFIQTGVAVAAPQMEPRRDRLRALTTVLTAAIDSAIADPERSNALAAEAGRTTLRLSREEITEARRGFEDAWVREAPNPAQVADTQKAFDRMREMGLFRDPVDVAAFWRAA